MAKSFWIEDWWPVVLVSVLGLTLLILAVIGLLGSRRRQRGRPTLRLGQVTLAACALAGGTVFAFTALLFTQFGGYHTLTEWEVVARVKSGGRGKLQQFTIEYTTLAGGRDASKRSFPVYGDQWRAEAYVVQWKPFLHPLGLTRSFKLVKLAGVYHRERDYLERPVTFQQLGRGSETLWHRLHRGDRVWPFSYVVHSAYTTSVSSAPSPGELFDIVGTKAGLALRKVTY